VCLTTGRAPGLQPDSPPGTKEMLPSLITAASPMQGSCRVATAKYLWRLGSNLCCPFPPLQTYHSRHQAPGLPSPSCQRQAWAVGRGTGGVARAGLLPFPRLRPFLQTERPPLSPGPLYIPQTTTKKNTTDCICIKWPLEWHRHSTCPGSQECLRTFHGFFSGTTYLRLW